MWKKFIGILFIVTTVTSYSFPPPPKSENIEGEEEEQLQAEYKQFDGVEKSAENAGKIMADGVDLTYRLPNNTRPLRYDLWVLTDVEKEIFEFRGRVKITIRAVETTDYVVLQYRETIVDKVELLEDDTRVNLVAYKELPLEYEFLRINLTRMMAINETFVIEINYHGQLHWAIDNGFYKANYTDTESGRLVWYATTKFEPHHARHLFPCYDEPQIRAPIALSVQHDRSYRTFANMPRINETQVPGTNYVISYFQESPPMQTYLLAFLTSAFEFVSNNAKDVEQRIFAKPQSIIDGEADYSARICGSILYKLEELLNVSYPLPKLDHAAITQFPSGAMENFGFISYREPALLLNKSYTPAQVATFEKYIARLLAHEDTHQWFGNTVSPKWWTHLWLNEGFATLFEYYIPHLVFPTLGFEEEFRTAQIQASLRNDVPTNPASVPMSTYVETPTAIRGRFNFVSYGKAGTVLSMFQQALTPKTFHKGLQYYLHDMHYMSAEPEDLFRSLQKAYNEDNTAGTLSIANVMSTWVYQAGYPIVSVEKTGSNFVFKQERYPSGNGELYAIPITFATKQSANFDRKTPRLWLRDFSMEVAESTIGAWGNDWIVLNIQQSGFYRVSYSENLWMAIRDDLKVNSNAIHLTNRRILQEELNIGMTITNRLLASTALEFLTYLSNEESYLVWNDANVNFALLNRTLYGTEMYSDYMNLIAKLTRTHLTRIGYEAIGSEEEIGITQLRARVKILNCYALDENCLQHELAKLVKYYENEVENPAPDFCSAFRLANETLLDHYLSELTSNLELANRDVIGRTIHCSLNENFAGLLTLAVEDESNILTPAQRGNIILNLFTNQVGFNAAMAYLERNLDKINSFTAQLSNVINSVDNYQKLNVLFARALEEEAITEEIAQAVRNSIENNLQWQARHADSVKGFFLRMETTTSTTTTTTSTTIDSTPSTEAPTTLGARGLIVSIALIITSLLTSLL